jgi:hypothetical protein
VANEDDVFAGVGTYCYREPDHLPAVCGCDFIFVGTAEHACSPHLLRRLGITHVLNCAAGDCRVPYQELAARGIAYAQIEAVDAEGYPLLDTHLARCLSFLSPCLKAGSAGKALVHSVAGRNRSAALAVAAVMWTMRIPLPVLLRRLFQRRPLVLSNLSFRKQLFELADRRKLLVAPQGLLRAAAHWAAAHGGHGIVCEHCGQPHVALPEARLDFSLRASCASLTVGALVELLAAHLGPSLHVTVEPANKGHAPYELPIRPFAALPLARLPLPISGAAVPTGVPAALLVVRDLAKGVRYTVGVHDVHDVGDGGGARAKEVDFRIESSPS